MRKQCRQKGLQILSLLMSSASQPSKDLLAVYQSSGPPTVSHVYEMYLRGITFGGIK